MKKILPYLLLGCLATAGAARLVAQSLQRSNVPPPPFEVTGSIYPWEVHDEGIDLILDNMTGMAGVNSVYLIAVMHEEHRPFNNDNLPGEYYFIHNPVRSQWDAEDSRAYFSPDWNAYGAIKPLLSAHDWLNKTDWLKIVLDKAHARGLRAGVEVSHTYIPVEVLNRHPEYKQRDINGKPADRPCFSHPDVRAYMLNLYGDLAKHYDVDYIQTCMLLFSRSDDPRNGTCFCDACKKLAALDGFDMEAARVILRDNPYAQPQLNQWLDFRRKHTTAIYKEVTDRIHRENPQIDFRLNDLNDRSSGLALEELTGHINSVHLSTHTEQNGYQKTDRQSRIATTQYFMGKDIRIIPGVPTRLLATEDIVRSSIQVSVAAGARGIGIKHYDGSPYSRLRAVRNALHDAGVAGFEQVLGLEVEKMHLSGYDTSRYLLEYCVQTRGTGTAEAPFPYASGIYDVVVSYVDEKEGQGMLSLSVGGKTKAKWQLNEEVDCWRRKTIPGVVIKEGQEIRIEGKADGKEMARIDFIEFVPRKKQNNSR